MRWAMQVLSLTVQRGNAEMCQTELLAEALPRIAHKCDNNIKTFIRQQSTAKQSHEQRFGNHSNT